tara:strand:- start:1351 stop:1638 length:288 start_codon:yes stop_codon:yes gene_type:complete
MAEIEIGPMRQITDEQREIMMAEVRARAERDKASNENIEIGPMREISKEERAKIMAQMKADMEAYEKSKAKNFNKGGTVGTPRTGFQDYRKNRFR